MNSTFYSYTPPIPHSLSTHNSITTAAYLSQPQGKAAIVSGLNHISRIFALLGEILVRIRVDKRSPPRGQFATARLEEVQSLHTRILETLDHAPPSLQLKGRLPRRVSPLGSAVGGGGMGASASTDVVGGGDTRHRDDMNALGNVEYYCGTGFRQATLGEDRDFFNNPKASRENALDPFLVMQANVHVTQVSSDRPQAYVAISVGFTDSNLCDS